MARSRIDNLPPDLGATSTLTTTEAQQLVDEYADAIARNNTGPKDRDLRDFFGLTQNAIWSRQNSERVPEDKRLLVLEDDVAEPIDTEAVSYVLRARQPGAMSQGAPGRGSIKEKTPHLRAIINHPQHPGEKLQVIGKKYDNWIDFFVYAKTSAQALNRTLWLERLMDDFRWYFVLNGFDVLHEGTGQRKKVTVDDLELVRYELSFFVRNEEIRHYGLQELKEVIISHTADTSESS